MTSKTLDDKIRSVFGEFAVDKGLIRRMGVSGDDRHVPSYVMDWIVTYTAKTQKTTSSLERAVQEFIAKHLPAKGEKERILLQARPRRGLDGAGCHLRDRQARSRGPLPGRDPLPRREQGDDRPVSDRSERGASARKYLGRRQDLPRCVRRRRRRQDHRLQAHAGGPRLAGSVLRRAQGVHRRRMDEPDHPHPRL